MGKKHLSEGLKNVLFAAIIDNLSADVPYSTIITNIKQFYKEHMGYELTNGYAVIDQAKALWLTNVNLPALENYKKEQYVKSEILESDIKTKSRNDIVRKSEAILDIWKYKDSLVGLGKENQTDINIAVNIDRQKIVSALEVGDFSELDKKD